MAALRRRKTPLATTRGRRQQSRRLVEEHDSRRAASGGARGAAVRRRRARGDEHGPRRAHAGSRLRSEMCSCAGWALRVAACSPRRLRTTHGEGARHDPRSLEPTRRTRSEMWMEPPVLRRVFARSQARAPGTGIVVVPAAVGHRTRVARGARGGAPGSLVLRHDPTPRPASTSLSPWRANPRPRSFPTTVLRPARPRLHGALQCGFPLTEDGWKHSMQPQYQGRSVARREFSGPRARRTRRERSRSYRHSPAPTRSKTTGVARKGSMLTTAAV